MTYHHIRVEPVSKALGAEIGGVDLTVPLPEPISRGSQQTLARDHRRRRALG